ncbi:MAG: glycosyltransferase family 2 protein [Paludibacteraceae bacterium]|nr:glycosyltransferase family 2 protein [Paludibacteraceae bacterium]
MKKEKKTLISVVIPSYNRADTVGQTIDSILVQKVDADIEIVIGDDCSTDNAREVLLRYKEMHPDVIKLLFHKQNMGLGANWATCVKACNGKYICNCDNDDYWHNPHKLQIQLDYMESHPACNICITNHRTHNRTTGVIKECMAHINRDMDIQSAMWFDCSFCNATIMYRADFMKAHLDLDEFIKRRFTLQDWPAWVILTACTDIDVLPESTATFGIETVSITRPDSVERYAKRLAGDKEVCRYLGELFPEKFPYDEQEWELYANGRLCAKAFDVGDFESAKKYGKECSGVGRFKKWCSQNRLLFEMYRMLKRIKCIAYEG